MKNKLYYTNSKNLSNLTWKIMQKQNSQIMQNKNRQTSLNTKQIIEYLEKKLEFSKTEAQIYLTLLQSGPLSVAELAKIIHINRTATYPYIASLLEKGILAEIVQNYRKKLFAVDPERLNYLLEKKLDLLLATKSELPTIVSTLQTTFTKPQNAEKVENKYYKGKNGVKEIYHQALQSTMLRSYVSVSIMQDVIPENRERFLQAFKKNKEIHILEIFEDSPFSREAGTFQSTANQRFSFKLLPKNINLFAADILIYDNKVSIINVGNKNNITGVVMENPDYYKNSRELFDLMWKMLPEVKI